MKKAFSFLVLVFLSGTFSARLSAELSMPHIFADHMVLQRNEAVNLWGSASPKEKVTVELNGQKTSVRADASGKWNATLRPMEAGGPYTLIVKGKKNASLSTMFCWAKFGYVAGNPIWSSVCMLR